MQGRPDPCLPPLPAGFMDKFDPQYTPNMTDFQRRR